MREPQLTVGAAIGAMVVLIPLPAHLRVRNVAVLSMIACIFSTNIINVVDTLLWAGNVRDVAPVWCDIVTNVQLFSYFSVAWGSFCVCKYLEWVSSARSIKDCRHSRLIFELVLCVGLPLLVIPLRYIVSTNRYAIVEDFGCFPFLHPSLPFVMLISVPQLMICVGTFSFATVAIWNIVRRHAYLALHLRDSQPVLTTPRFIRLLAMCISMGIWGVFVNALILYDNVAAGLRPWPGWATVHQHFSLIVVIPTSAQTPAFRSKQALTYWVYTVTAYIFFAIFAFSEDVREEYHRYWAFLVRKVARRDTCSERGSAAENCASKRPYVRRPSIQRNSFVSNNHQVEKGYQLQVTRTVSDPLERGEGM